MISFTPSEEQQMIVNTIKQFATDEMREIYRDCEESGEKPDDIVNTAWELGLIATGIPEDLGGLGGEQSAVTGSLIAEELAWGDLAIAMKILCPALVAFPILEMGTEEQKKKYRPAFCDEKYKAATATLIEPRFNFDPLALSTTATTYLTVRSATSRWQPRLTCCWSMPPRMVVTRASSSRREPQDLRLVSERRIWE